MKITVGLTTQMRCNSAPPYGLSKCDDFHLQKRNILCKLFQLMSFLHSAYSVCDLGMMVYKVTRYYTTSASFPQYIRTRRPELGENPELAGAPSSGGNINLILISPVLARHPSEYIQLTKRAGPTLILVSVVNTASTGLSCSDVHIFFD